eukprot:comp24342_c2_seq14/m.46386 comp24342_c2_seq14/g.46386  ORF comp24342_c2_seq14/g.46386 comp24342_c2_seq14/m.46386 type:complete len:360 (-) comp24342_c2_seq14:999-2078(-)
MEFNVSHNHCLLTGLTINDQEDRPPPVNATSESSPIGQTPLPQPPGLVPESYSGLQDDVRLRFSTRHDGLYDETDEPTVALDKGSNAPSIPNLTTNMGTSFHLRYVPDDGSCFYHAVAAIFAVPMPVIRRLTASLLTQEDLESEKLAYTPDNSTKAPPATLAEWQDWVGNPTHRRWATHAEIGKLQSYLLSEFGLALVTISPRHTPGHDAERTVRPVFQVNRTRREKMPDGRVSGICYIALINGHYWPVEMVSKTSSDMAFILAVADCPFDILYTFLAHTTPGVYRLFKQQLHDPNLPPPPKATDGGTISDSEAVKGQEHGVREPDIIQESTQHHATHRVDAEYDADSPPPPLPLSMFF